MDIPGMNGDVGAVQRSNGSALLCRILEEGGTMEGSELGSCDCHMTTAVGDSCSSVENPFLVTMEFLDPNILAEEHNGFGGEHVQGYEATNGLVMAVPCKLQSVGEASENESTAEERDTVPCDSPSTTDTGAMLEEDGMGKVTLTSQQEGRITIASARLGTEAHQYENWIVVEELARNRLLRAKRNKGFRAAVRQRAPQPLPRQSYLKMKLSRPSPIVRKRRPYGKPRPPLATSEGDMAQADEMGEEDQVSDDGFVDGSESFRRKTKRRQTGMQVLLPAASPPSSPSHSPMYRKKSLSRKNRTKPRPRKPSKLTMAFADISTQETTTPGPGSSDTSNEADNPLMEEVEPLTADRTLELDKNQGQTGSETPSHLPSPHHSPYRSAIPRPTAATTRAQSDGAPELDKDLKQTRSQTPPRFLSPRHSPSKSSIPRPTGMPTPARAQSDGALDVVRIKVHPGSQTPPRFPSPHRSFSNKSAIPRPVPSTARDQQAGSQTSQGQDPATSLDGPQPLGDDSQTSDIELTSSALSLSSAGLIMGRRLESDLSTAPLSSETSDMDTSGNERAKELNNKPQQLTSNVATVLECMSKNGVARATSTVRKTPPTGRIHVNKGTENGRLERQSVGKPSISKKPPFIAPVGGASGSTKAPLTPLEVKQSSAGKLVHNNSASSLVELQKKEEPACSSPGMAPPVHSQSVPNLRIKPTVPAKPQLPKPEVKPKPTFLGQGKMPPASLASGGKPTPRDRAVSVRADAGTNQPRVGVGRTTSERQGEVGRTNRQAGRPSLRPGKPESSGGRVRPQSFLSQRSVPSLSNTKDAMKETNPTTPGELRSPRVQPPLRKPLPTPSTDSANIESSTTPSPLASKSSISQTSSNRVRKPLPPARVPSTVKKAESSLATGKNGTKSGIYSIPAKPTPPARPQAQKEEAITPPKPLQARKISPKPVALPPASPTSSSQLNRSPVGSSRRPPPQPPSTPPKNDSPATASSPANEPPVSASSPANEPVPNPLTKTPPTISPTSLLPVSPPTYSPRSESDSVSQGCFVSESSSTPTVASSIMAGEDVPDFAVSAAGNNQPRNYEEYVPTLNRRKMPFADFSSSQPPGEESGNEEMDQVGFSSPRLGAFRRSPSSASSMGKRPTLVKPSRPSPGGSVESGEDDPPPLPPRNYLLEDSLPSSPSNLSATLEGMSEQDGRTMFRSFSISECPPPLPSQPIPRRKTFVGCSTPTRSPISRRREPVQSMYSLAEVPPSPSLSSDQEMTDNLYEEVNVKPYYVPRQWRKPGPLPPPLISPGMYQHYEMASPFAYRPTPSYLRTPPTIRNMDGDRRFSASICVSNSSGLSPVTIRRANSDKTSARIPKILVSTSMADDEKRRSVQRTPSVDYLDDRMNQSSWTALTDPGYSSGEEENPGLVSPTEALPQPPKSSFVLPLDSNKGENPDDEPLYQYLNHIEFGGTLNIPRTESSSSTSSNQLELARQLSFSHRKLWCEQPVVVQSGVLCKISDEERKLQEAIFEIITSEASYLRSLNVLIEHFMDHPGMNPNLPVGRRVMDRRQHHVIFSNVREIRDISAKLLHELQQRQRQTALNMSICDIVLKYAEDDFGCYIPYCTNQVYQTRELRELIDSSVMFREYLKSLESHRRCQSLNIQSFLLLPVQRITRMPLLILAVLNRTRMDHPDHGLVERTLRTFQNIVTACNNGARQMERTEELHHVCQKLEFGKMKPFPLVSVMRQLERRGSLIRLQVEQRLFGKPRIKQTPMYLLAFTDYVIVAKKKKNSKGDFFYKVVDYASRAVIEVEKLKTKAQMTFPKHVFGEQETIARATWAVSTAMSEHAFLLVFLENALQKLEKYIFVCQNDTERTRWLEALTHPRKEMETEDEKIYERWDCPQVQAVYDYEAQQPDELSLMCGDVVKVFRKMADGWYEGERMRDLQWGWFPSNFTMEIENEHTKARNLRERHRLLCLPHTEPQTFAQQLNSIK